MSNVEGWRGKVDTTIVADSDAPKVIFSEIPHIAELTTILGREIDWNMIDQLPRINRVYQSFAANPNTQDLVGSGVHGEIMEIYVNYLLKRNAAAREFPVPFFLNPIPNGCVSENFRFVTTRNGGYTIQKIMEDGDLQNFSEIDGLIEINGVPVVLEVKSGTQRRSLGKSVSEKRTQKIREALRDVYPDTGFGYMVVAPSDIVSDFPSTRESFRQRGGIIASLGATSISIDENVRRLARKREINFFDSPRIPKQIPPTPNPF